MLELLVTLHHLQELELYKDADGFIIGNHDITARLNVGFSYAEMMDVVAKVKELGKKIYLNFNRIIVQADYEAMKQWFELAIELSFDGILFSDLAIYQWAKAKGLMSLLIYASETQIVNYHDIQAFHQQNIPAFIVSKEMTYENILKTLRKTNASIGLLAFGHYSMFYSKRKLVSHYFEKYELAPIASSIPLTIRETTRSAQLPILQDQQGTHVFSHDILCAIEEFLPLIQAGVRYFIFDSLWLEPRQVQQVIALFLMSYAKQTSLTLGAVAQATQLTNLSKGFFYKKIGVK